MLPKLMVESFECSKCGLRCSRDLNAAISITHDLTRGMGWGSREQPELPNEVQAVKAGKNRRSFRL